MTSFSATCERRAPIALLLLSLGIAPAYSDTITGVFSNPVLIGYVLNTPDPGTTLTDNTNTAVYSITNNGSTLTWGTITNDPSIPASQSYSQLSFSGMTIPADDGALFEIGTIHFLNGANDADSIIFGATLSFYDGAVFLGSDSVIITARPNLSTGTGLTQAQLAQDADYINICGNNSNICASSLEAYEDSEGGVGVTGNLFGSIVGDPTVILTDITAPDQQDSGGIVGNLPPLSAVPEPATIVLVSTALLFGIASRRRRTS